MLIAQGLDKRFGGKVLFAGLDWQVGAGERIGLVGANGAGKTTLLRALAGEDPPDAGQVTLGAGARLAYLPQEAPRVDQGTVRARAESGAAHVQALGRRLDTLTAALGEADAEGAAALAEAYDEAQQAYAQAGGYTLTGTTQAVLEGLGFGADGVDRPVAELSGGWWMRVELARLLVAAPDYLLLDEPTNHLDAPAVAWLERFLQDYAGSWVVVSHDRTFLNRCVRAVCELSGARLTRYTGNYDAYVAQKAAREEQARAQAATTARKAAHLTSFIDRFGAKASKAKQAQSRAKQLAKLTADAPAPPPRGRTRTMALRLQPPVRSGQVVASLQQARVVYGDRCVLGPVDFRLERGEKVVVVGPNGAGKSTLLRAVAGAVPLASGTRTLGHNVTPYYFAQHQLDMLRPGATVLEEAQAALPNAPMGQVRALLGAFLFDDDAVVRAVEALSGGEKARLALAKMLAQPANFLLLDEPTNHLDLPSREALEAALEAFAGTVLVVSHDRYFAQRVATRVLEVPGDAGLRPFAGDFAAYEAAAAAAAQALGQATRDADATRAKVARTAKASPVRAAEDAAGWAEPSGPGDGKASYAAGKAARKREAKRQRDIAEVEGEVARAEARLRELDAALCDPATFADGPRSAALLQERSELSDGSLVALYARWEALHTEEPPA